MLGKHVEDGRQHARVSSLISPLGAQESNSAVTVVSLPTELSCWLDAVWIDPSKIEAQGDG